MIKPTPLRVDKFSVHGLGLSYGLYQFNSKDLQRESLLPQFTARDLSRSIARSRSGGYIGADAIQIDDGDIIKVSEQGQARVILSKASRTNTLLVTEQCDNLCTFCSQPPKTGDDSILLSEALTALIAFKHKKTIGISGGEPFIYGSKFVRFLREVVDVKSKHRLHVLTNGRAFSSISLVEEMSKITNKERLVFGIPLYSVDPCVHDDLVGARGAWFETVRGLINASNLGFQIELRFIPTAQNYQELPLFVEFVANSFPFLGQLSIMGLEPQGWARKNWDNIFISPDNYREELIESQSVARCYNLPIKIFNHPLCYLPREVWGNAVKSISDWKNYYPKECEECSVLASCGGFFTSANRKFKIVPRITTDE